MKIFSFNIWWILLGLFPYFLSRFLMEDATGFFFLTLITLSFKFWVIVDFWSWPYFLYWMYIPCWGFGTQSLTVLSGFFRIEKAIAPPVYENIKREINRDWINLMGCTVYGASIKKNGFKITSGFPNFFYQIGKIQPK